MPTLVIHAPTGKVQSGDNKKSFERTFADGIGTGYAIAWHLHHQLYPGCGVVVLDKDQAKRAEGKLVRLVEVDKTKTGMLSLFSTHLHEVAKADMYDRQHSRLGGWSSTLRGE